MIKRKLFSLFTLGILLVNIFVLSIIPFASASSIIGYTGNVNSTSYGFGASNALYLAGPFTASTTGYFGSINFYAIMLTSSPVNLAVCVYADNTGFPGALLTSSIGTISGSTVSYSLYSIYGLNYQASAGQEYWIGLCPSSTSQFDLANQNGGVLPVNMWARPGITYTSLPNLAGSGSIGAYGTISIYATILSDPFAVSNQYAYAQIGSATTYSAKWTTNETLSHFMVQSNQTGTTTNSSWQSFGSSIWSNYTGAIIPLNYTWVGKTVAWRIYANTTDGYPGDTGIQYTTILDASYGYVFNGVYDESNGLKIGGCNVTAYFDDGTASYNFYVNGSGVTYYPASKPLYFEYNIQSLANTTDPTITRQYWLQPTETNGNYNIFGNEIGLVHIVFQIRALGGVGLSSYLSVQRIINGTYQTVEQRQVDATGIATISLQPYTVYRVLAWSGSTYTTFGNINTYTTPIILTISALSFPNTVLSQYKYVHIYASRPDATTIQVSYEDTDSQTLSVSYVIKNNLGATVYTNTHTGENSFIDIWAGASTNTTYYLEATVTQSRFGVSTYNMPLFGSNAQTSPISLDIFGNFGNIDSTQIIWIIIILAVFLCFSALNSWLGALCGVAVAAIFVYLGWLQIPQAVIVTAFGFVILAAIAAWKHRST